MRWLVVAVAACWTSPVAPPPTAPASCDLRDRDLTTADPVALLDGGQRFATLTGPFPSLHATIAGTTTHARVETADVVLEGELALAELPVHPRGSELHDGWLLIDRGFARSARAGQAEVAVTLPRHLVPRTVTVALACDRLTFAEPSRVHAAGPLGAVVFAAGTTTKLARTPAGDTVATIAVPTDSPVEDEVQADVLERRAGMLRVRISDDNSVVGWVPERPLAEPGMLYGTLHGDEIGDTSEPLRCHRDIAIYVDARRVGHFKPDVAIHQLRDIGTRIEVDLGEATTHPYIYARDIVGCSD